MHTVIGTGGRSSKIPLKPCLWSFCLNSVLSRRINVTLLSRKEAFTQPVGRDSLTEVLSLSLALLLWSSEALWTQLSLES